MIGNGQEQSGSVKKWYDGFLIRIWSRKLSGNIQFLYLTHWSGSFTFKPGFCTVERCPFFYAFPKANRKSFVTEKERVENEKAANKLIKPIKQLDGRR